MKTGGPVNTSIAAMNDLPEHDVLSVGKLGLSAAWLDAVSAVLGSDGVIRQAGPGLGTWLGTAQDQLAGRSFTEELSRIDNEWDAPLTGWLNDVPVNSKLELATGREQPFQHFHLELTRHQDLIFVRIESVLPTISELTEGSLNESLRDVRAQEAMFRRLVHAESQLDSLTRRWPGVIFNQKADFSFLFVSPQLVEMTGVEMDQWRHNPNLFWEVLHESDEEDVRSRINESVLKRQPVSHTFRIRHSGMGRVTYVMEHRDPVITSNGIVLGYEGFWIDVTRQTIAERRLSTAAWKETLSVVTMGLAHDFRNLMAGVSALSEQFMHSEEKDHPFMESMNLIMNNSRQASQLVNRILSLHHGQPGERNYHDLNLLLKEIEELTRKVIPCRITVTTALHDGSLPVYIDAVEFRQVAINLLINAADAITERGTISIGSAVHEEQPEATSQWGAIPKAPAISFTIGDTGCGIKPHHIENLFDPFFTTKELNKGSGLGLFNARLFAEKHHGAISVNSEEGTGTTFQVWLPLADFTEGEREYAQETQQRRSLLFAGPKGRNGDNTVEFLRTAGYHVVVAHSCELAVAMLDSGDYPFSGLYVQTENLNSDFNGLTSYKSSGQEKLRTILQIVGRNEDEFNTRFLNRADLILGADLSQAAIHQKLGELFARD